MDGRPDAPGEDVAASLEEKQAQLAEAQAAVEVRVVFAWLLFRLKLTGREAGAAGRGIGSSGGKVGHCMAVACREADVEH
jgi:hypothetical protein